MPNAPDAAVAYVLKGFPRLSETFIANEIHQLESLGLQLRLYSVKGGEHELVHDVVQRIRAPVDYLPELTSLSATPFLSWLRVNVPRVADAHLHLLRRRPRAWLATLARALGMCWRYREHALAAPRKVFVKEFLQAGAIATRVLRDPSIRHIHGHFCHGATTIAWFVSGLTGLPFSFTAHAKDIYLEQLNPRDLLPRKLAAARFVATCTGANARHLRERAARGERVHTIYHGLDTGFFAPAERAPASDGLPLVVSVGRFVEKKGFAFLVEACAELEAAGSPVRCVIVGERGPDYERIAKMVRSAGLEQRIELRGPMTQEALRALYRQASLFVLPCQVVADGDRDGIPNVLAEAMATGLAVVSTDISGIPELVTHEADGLLVPACDARALAAAMRRLIENGELRSRLGAAARAKICACFDSKQTTRTLRDLFARSMAVRGSGRMTREDAVRATAPRAFLAPPWDEASEAALTEHLRARPSVRCFVVADPEATRRDRIDGVLAGVFELNGETHALPAPIDWLRNPSADLEWHITLHKFYYAVGLGIAYRDSGDARYAQCWIELVSSWIARTPPGFIAADVTGRRVQNWIYAFQLFVVEGDATVPAGFVHAFLASLDEQVRYLCSHLAPERNHRTLALYAILLAGVVFPELRDAAHWRRFALAELVRNIERDLLADGVQCEQSTDYHHIVLRNYLSARRLAALNDIDVPPRMDRLMQRALDFALHACKPDGIVPAFSDGDARSHRDVLEAGHALYGRDDLLYAASGGRRGTPPARRTAGFPQAGYYVMRSGWGERDEPYADERYLMYDCGPIGRGNHGHLDLHSFELAAYGRSLVVDPGRYTYDESRDAHWRRTFRGTTAHNTITVDGREQTRYAPRGRRWRIDGPPPDREVRVFASRADCDVVHGVVRSHEYDAIHERCIWLVCGEYWIVTDILRAPTMHRYDLRFHLGAQAQDACRIEGGGDAMQVHTPQLVIAQPASRGTTLAIDAGFISARYGEKLPAPVVRYTRDAATTFFNTVLHPFRTTAPSLVVESVPVAGESDIDCVATALRVCTQTAQGLTTDLCFVADRPAAGAWHFAGYAYAGTHLLLRLEADGVARVLYADAGASLTRMSAADPSGAAQ